MKARIIINSKNKKSHFTQNLYDVCKVLSKKDYEIDIKLTSREYRASHYIDDAYDLFIVSGGDGTINEVVNAVSLLENKPDVMYFPTGTVNDFGNSLGLDCSFQKQLSILRKHKVKAIDSGKVNDIYFNYICGFGPFTRTSYITTHSDKNKFGKLAYIKNVFEELPEISKSYHLEVNCDGERFKGEFTYALIVNSSSVAGFRQFLKNDKLDDGLFNLILVSQASENTVSKVFKLLSGGFVNDLHDDEIIYRQFKKVSILTQDEIEWTLDGERGPIGSVEVEVIPGNIRIITP